MGTIINGKAPANGKSCTISAMRIAATIAVVLSHVCSTLTDNIAMFPLTHTQKVFFDILINILRWPVPCFFMMTGALLLDENKQITVRDCITKYCKRILLALFIFGIPLAMLEIVFETHTLSSGMVWEALIRVINGKSFGHLWYLYTLIGIYLALPLLRLLVRYGTKRLLLYMIGLLFLFEFCIPVFNKAWGLSIAFTLPVGTYEIFYVLLGKYLHDERPKWLRSVPVLVGIIAAIVGLTVVVCITGDGSNFMGYKSPLNAALTVCIFALFYTMGGDCTATLWKLDRLCFGVYLIHPVFIQFVYKFLKITPASFDWYPVAVVVFGVFVTAVSFFGSWIMSLIKPLKKYVL